MKWFSVLISLYIKDNPLFFQQALDSVFDQTVSPTEVVLVEDGPLTSELYAVVDNYQKKHPELKVIPLEKNVGLGVALNEGLKYCSYEWVARMDADDICFPDRFEKQLNFIDKHPDVSFISSTTAEFTDAITNVHSYRRLPENHEDIYRYAKKRCPLNHPAVMYKKDVVLSLGGYREFPEDYHLWIRALMNGYKFYNIQEPLLYFRTNFNTIKRRGGWKYARIELKHQYDFYRMGFLSFFQFIFNCIIRISVRLIPSKLRKMIYFNFLRKSQ